MKHYENDDYELPDERAAAAKDIRRDIYKTQHRYVALWHYTSADAATARRACEISHETS